MAWTEKNLKRSYPCNTELLVTLRNRKKWTQPKLAEEAGYSARLICKAESGEPISTEAIDTLAEALSTVEEDVYPEDLICDPVRLTKIIMAAFYNKAKDAAEGFMLAITPFLHERAVFRVSGDTETIPFAGTHNGHNEIRLAMRLFFSLLEAPNNKEYETSISYFANGNQVVARGTTNISPIGRLMEKPMEFVHIAKYQQGKLLFYDALFDTEHGATELQRQ